MKETSKKLFPEINMMNIKKSEQTKINRYKHERFLYFYLERMSEGWSICDFFKQLGTEKIALSGVSDFVNIICRDIRLHNYTYFTGFICDRNAKAYPMGRSGAKVIDYDDLLHKYRKNDIKKIIVTSVTYENDIIENLCHIGIEIEDIIPLTSIICSY